uniref:Uncharacterized protein n=1 Tax=Arundo donax TaxID=35708 RepID=A0A0A9CU04_ARUDO
MDGSPVAGIAGSSGGGGTGMGFRSRRGWDCGGLEEEEGESLKGEVDEGTAGVGEEAAEVGTHHALPPHPVTLVELRFDVAGDGAAVGDVEEVERAGGRRRRRGLHPRRHVCVLHQSLPLQHPRPPPAGCLLILSLPGRLGAWDTTGSRNC